MRLRPPRPPPTTDVLQSMTVAGPRTPDASGYRNEARLSHKSDPLWRPTTARVIGAVWRRRTATFRRRRTPSATWRCPLRRWKRATADLRDSLRQMEKRSASYARRSVQAKGAARPRREGRLPVAWIATALNRTARTRPWVDTPRDLVAYGGVPRTALVPPGCRTGGRYRRYSAIPESLIRVWAPPLCRVRSLITGPDASARGSRSAAARLRSRRPGAQASGRCRASCASDPPRVVPLEQRRARPAEGGVRSGTSACGCWPSSLTPGQTLSSARLHPPGSNRQAARVTAHNHYGPTRVAPGQRAATVGGRL